MPNRPSSRHALDERVRILVGVLERARRRAHLALDEAAFDHRAVRSEDPCRKSCDATAAGLDFASRARSESVSAAVRQVPAAAPARDRRHGRGLPGAADRARPASRRSASSSASCRRWRPISSSSACSSTRRASRRGCRTRTSCRSSISARSARTTTSSPWSTSTASTCSRSREAEAQRGGRVPLAIAVRIVSNVAEGLEHAHRATDGRGQPLGLVHRDVTPSNVIVSFDGVGQDPRLRHRQGGGQEGAHRGRRHQGQDPVHEPRAGAGRGARLRAATSSRSARCSTSSPPAHKPFDGRGAGRSVDEDPATTRRGRSTFYVERFPRRWRT